MKRVDLVSMGSFDRVVRRVVAVVPWVAWLAACDSPGGGGKTLIGSDVRTDTTSTTDTSILTVPDDTATSSPDAIEETTVAPPDTVEDTAVEPDTVVPPGDTVTTPDTVQSVCAQGCLPAIPTAGALVAFTQYGTTTPPPTLGGGAAPTGQWRLDAVDIYPYGTFVDGFSITIQNEGDTRGRANFSGDAMQLGLFLDLHIYVDAFGTTGDDTGSANVAIGGCHEVDDPYIVGELDKCAAGWPDTVTPPNQLGYASSTNSLQLELELAPEFLIAMLPPDQQDSASFVIVGPLYLVASLERP